MKSASGAIDAVCREHPGCWVVLEIVRHDPPALQPQEVRVVAVRDDKGAAYDLAAEEPLRRFVQYGMTAEEQARTVVVAGA